MSSSNCATGNGPAFDTNLCCTFNMLLMERQPDGSFRLTSGPPADFREVYPEAFESGDRLRPDLRFPFIEYFLDEAKEGWRAGRRVKSGPWLETLADGREVALSASAAMHDGRELLVIELLGESYEVQQSLLQHGREKALVQELLEEEVHRRTAQIREREEEIALRLVWASESRDGGETGAHIRRLGLYSEVMAQALGWSREKCYEIRIAATMHDIGKIGIPDSILRKPGPLTANEFEIMKTHTLIGGRILAGSETSLLQTARAIALSHHEKWDGTGYPRGLAGEAIPVQGRIVAIADVFDALVHKRVYKDAWTIDQAIEHLVEDKGTRFDPGLIELFLGLTGRFREIVENTSSPLFEGFHAEEEDQYY